jgi:hypothetical protein
MASRPRSLLVPFALLVLLLPPLASADFTYPDFAEASGLRYNGDATTSSCDDGLPYAYNAAHGVDDPSDEGSQVPVVEEGTSVVEEHTHSTHTDEDAARTPRFLAGFPHRDGQGKSPDPSGCPLRLRLTPARPYKRGSVMRLEAAPVLNGFETGFSFQITDPSQACTLVKDASFGILSHRTCTIRGGDGLAFVLHNDPNASAALGVGGSGIGYAGIRNALVVEFDTLYNGGLGSGEVDLAVGLQDAASGGGGDADLVEDHVALQASVRAGAAVVQGVASRLAVPRATSLGDGRVHTVRVVYWPYLKFDLVPSFTASTLSPVFLKDGGDERRVGTLAVYVDDMRETNPLIATPLNLNTLLQLRENQAVVGFTAATGSAWQKHDVTEWYFCEQPDCPYLDGDPLLTRYYE